jgi:glycosyltransferase involved in cell wall biosynthesis
LRNTAFMAHAWLARHALRRASTKANILLVTSELDRTKIEAVCGGFVATNIPNSGSSFGKLRSDPGPVACFIGTGVYPPNSEAVLWLVREIWPRIRQAVPDARLLIAGEDTELFVADGFGQGVESLGFVPDLAPVYDRARICVCPVRRGAGTRIKIIEAAMNGRPVVSTTVGAEGLSLVPGTEILLGDSPKDFARACIELLQEPDRAATMGQAARQRVEARHAPERIADRLIALCADLIDGVSERPVPANEKLDSLATREIGMTF